MNIEVELPDLGANGGDHATVEEWHFDEGEVVDKGAVLLELTSDSETVEVRAPQAGVLVERLVEEGDLVRVGEPVALIECDDDADDADEDDDEDADLDEDEDDE